MTPEQEEQVRRALGSLPSEGPVPPDVSTRLDARLADLVAERPPAAAAGEADELAARRRRRRWTTGLVAAASVAVIGIGLGTVADLTGDGNDALQSESAVDDTTAGDSGGSGARQPEAAPDMGSETAPEPATGDAPGGSGSTAGAPPDGVSVLAGPRRDVSTGTLDRDVARLADLADPRTAREGVTGDRVETEAPQALAAVRPCAVPAAGPGDLVVPVRLDGDRATLVLRRAADGAQVARIYACDDADALLVATTLPTR